MYKFIVGLPQAFFGFVSGVLVAIASTAVGNVVLAETQRQDSERMYTISLIALFAGGMWLIVGEYVADIHRRIDRNAEGFQGMQWERYSAAMDLVMKDTRARLYSLVVVAISLSIGWTFV